MHLELTAILELRTIIVQMRQLLRVAVHRYYTVIHVQLHIIIYIADIRKKEVSKCTVTSERSIFRPLQLTV